MRDAGMVSLCVSLTLIAGAPKSGSLIGRLPTHTKAGDLLCL
jgi:hypothetical protein